MKKQTSQGESGSEGDLPVRTRCTALTWAWNRLACFPNQEQGTGNGNRERESGNERTAVFVLKIQNDKKTKAEKTVQEDKLSLNLSLGLVVVYCCYVTWLPCKRNQFTSGFSHICTFLLGSQIF